MYDLILRGTEDIVYRAVQMLTSLDVEPPQISIQTEIISIETSEANSLGVQWSSQVNGTSVPNALSTTLTEQQSGDPLQLGRIVRNPFSLSATLNLLESHNKAKLINLSTTVVQNGREAVIHVGKTYYYEILASYSNGTPVYSTQSLNTGVTLKVRPLMSKDGVITLEITTDVTEDPTFTLGIGGLQLPQFAESDNTTVVQIHDNETWSSVVCARRMIRRPSNMCRG